MDVVVHAGLKLPVHGGYLLTTLFLQPEPQLLHVGDDIRGPHWSAHHLHPSCLLLLPFGWLHPLLAGQVPATSCGRGHSRCLAPVAEVHQLLHDDGGGAFGRLETYRLQQVGWWGEEVARTAAGVPRPPVGRRLGGGCDATVQGAVLGGSHGVIQEPALLLHHLPLQLPDVLDVGAHLPQVLEDLAVVVTEGILCGGWSKEGGRKGGREGGRDREGGMAVMVG